MKSVYVLMVKREFKDVEIGKTTSLYLAQLRASSIAQCYGNCYIRTDKIGYTEEESRQSPYTLYM